MTVRTGKAAGLEQMAATGAVPRFLVLRGEWLERNDADAVAKEVNREGLHPPFAVRSSATDEDGLLTSFAGMYETRLGVTCEALTEAISTVAASGAAARVCAYRDALGLPNGATTIDVVVQEMVDADVAGVSFSRDPVAQDRVRIEAVKGVGEELVSGNAIPECYQFDRKTLAERSYKAGRQYIEMRSDGSRCRLVGRDVRGRRLTPGQAKAITEHVLALEQLFPHAVRGVDVEWAIAAGEIKLLQCRPITAPVDAAAGSVR
jgi:phosphoenolpyruvate synthase/pyruvate phosphate dikinase